MNRPYDLTISQEAFFLHAKRKSNRTITTTISEIEIDNKVDRELVTLAYNICANRSEYYCYNVTGSYIPSSNRIEKIPYVEFRTKEEKNKFICSIKNCATNVISEIPYLIKNPNGVYSLLIKGCHLSFDAMDRYDFFNEFISIYKKLTGNIYA